MSRPYRATNIVIITHCLLPRTFNKCYKIIMLNIVAEIHCRFERNLIFHTAKFIQKFK